MRNLGRCLVVLQLVGLLAGCAEGQIQCCRGLLKSAAPMSHFDQRWNTFYYYNPAFEN